MAEEIRPVLMWCSKNPNDVVRVYENREIESSSSCKFKEETILESTVEHSVPVVQRQTPKQFIQDSYHFEPSSSTQETHCQDMTDKVKQEKVDYGYGNIDVDIKPDPDCIVPDDIVHDAQKSKEYFIMAPKRQKTFHDPEKLNSAIAAVKAGTLSQRKAAKVYGVPQATLNDKIKGKSPVCKTSTTILTQEEESKLADWLLTLASRGFGKTQDEVRQTAKAILDLRGGSSKSKDALPTTAWLYGFFVRHPQLATRSSMSLGNERSTITPNAVINWFASLKTHMDSVDPTLITDPSRIFNADETGFAFDAKSRKVVACKGSKHVYSVTSNNMTQVTVLACMSAAGQYNSPLLIYPYKRIPSKNLLGKFLEARLQVSDNGWITAPIFFSWLRDSFIPETKDVKKPLLLLVDGHCSHTSMVETSELCREHGIILFCLLAHTSHLIQPLDQAFLEAIKPAWAYAVKQHMFTTGEGVGLDTFAQVLKPVWMDTATLHIARKSFRAAGIHPFDPNRVLSGKLDPNRVLSGKLDPNKSFSNQTSPPSSIDKPPHDPKKSYPAHDNPPQNLENLPEISTIEHPSEISTIEKLPVVSALDNPLQLPAHDNHFQNSTPEHTPQLPAFENRPQDLDSLDFSVIDNIPKTSATERIFPASSFGPSTSEMICSTPKKSQSSLNCQQMRALQNYSLFLYDEMGRNQFLKYFSNLDSNDDNDERFKQFQQLANSLLTVCVNTQEPEKAFVTVEDI